MKKAFIQLLILSLTPFYCYKPALSGQGITVASESPASRILDQAKQILSDLKSTRYSYKVNVDEASGSYILDCSMLTCYILDRAAPQSLVSVPVGLLTSMLEQKTFIIPYQCSGDHLQEWLAADCSSYGYGTGRFYSMAK